MALNILILYAKNLNGVINRNAALDSYIYCLASLLNENERYAVYFNGVPYEKVGAAGYLGISKSDISFSKKWIPKKLKLILKQIGTLSAIRKLNARLSAGVSYDLVIEFYSYASDVGYRISKQRKIPLIVGYDAPVLEEYAIFNGQNPPFKTIIRKRELNTLLSATHIICYSKPVENYLNELTSKSLEISIHQNVDFSRFDFIQEKPSEGTINIGFIGSFLKWHKVELLLNSYANLKEMGYPVILYLLGVGAEFSSIKNLVNKSKYKADICMPGFVDGEELFKYKKKMHIGVMPGSNWYGAPNKIFEYGASKMAVIAPRTPTIEDLFLDNKELILFESDSEDDLFLGLKRLCDNPQLREEMATTLQRKIKSVYSKKATFNLYSNIIKSAINK